MATMVVLSIRVYERRVSVVISRMVMVAMLRIMVMLVTTAVVMVTVLCESDHKCHDQ